MWTNVNSNNLDQFVQHVDAIGGISSENFQAIQENFKLKFDTNVDISLDPYSELYINQQISLYNEIAGRGFYSTQNEVMAFNIDHHVAASNPYGIRSPKSLVHHYLRIAEVVHRAQLNDAFQVLDLGAGWGLSSEFLAILGGSVKALDVNPLFVSLIERRARRIDYPIIGQVKTFEELPIPEKFDFIMFYECLHHAVRPWDVIKACTHMLNPNGKIGLSGEPVQNIWWPNWGLRLDPISVYCIRKFGWFESGWSREFLSDMFMRSGLKLELFDSSIPIVGLIGIGKSDNYKSELADPFSYFSMGWIREGSFAISTGLAKIDLRSFPKGAQVRLLISNFRQTSVWVKIIDDKKAVVLQTILPPGDSFLALDSLAGCAEVTIESETWHPGAELRNNDTRVLSFHSSGLVSA